MKKKPTQKEVVLNLLKSGQVINGSLVYQSTKKLCGIGSLNCHKQLAAIRELGYVISEQWNYNESTKTRYKSYSLDRKKTPKKLLINK